MPRTRGWRPPLTEEEKLAVMKAQTEKTLRKAMLDTGMRDIKDLAAAAGYKQNAFYKKFQNQNWTQADLCRLVAALKIPAEEAVHLVVGL